MLWPAALLAHSANCSRSAPFSDHDRADGGVGGLVDQDEAAGLPVAAVRVEEQRLGQPQGHPAHLDRPMPSTSWDAIGWLCGRQIMSPREMSRSSSSTRVTDIGG